MFCSDASTAAMICRTATSKSDDEPPLSSAALATATIALTQSKAMMPALPRAARGDSAAAGRRIAGRRPSGTRSGSGRG